MAAFSEIISFVLLFCFVFTAKGQTNQSVINTKSSSGCICDLVVNGCDPDCCCDVDCSAADKETFTECSESKNVVFDDRVCVSDQMIFIHNVPFTTKNTGDGLFCIYHNNNKDQQKFSDVNVVTNNEDFTNSINSRNLYSYGGVNHGTGDDTIGDNYKVGDKILILFSNQVKGYLSLPTTLDSSSCNDYNAAGFFQDDATQCVRSLSDLSSECSNMPMLSATSYYSNFLIAMSPKAFSASINTTANSSSSPGGYNGSLLFAPQLSVPLLCRLKTGVLNDCGFATPPLPMYNMSTNTCENVVTEVLYTFIYSNETSNLLQLSVSFVLGNVQENFVQKFSIKFLKEGKENVLTRSGNPGYILDQPILAGLLNTDLATNKKAIILRTNNKNWLTIPKSSLDGSCSSGLNNRLSVNFNMNVRSGCIIRLNESSDCSFIQDVIYSALLGTNRPDHVASFGNSDVQIAADWVKIINDIPANTASGGSGMCSNMVLGMHIEVLFANVGYLANPQAKIIGVRFKYEQPQTITYQCIGQFCQSSSSMSQYIEVVSSVSFIDVSKPPISDQKSLPEFQSKAPSDFFHPFL